MLVICASDYFVYYNQYLVAYFCDLRPRFAFLLPPLGSSSNVCGRQFWRGRGIERERHRWYRAGGER